VLRHFISQADLSADEVRGLFRRTREMKPVRCSAELSGKSLVMFFEKTSTRTRLSFEIGMTQLGGHAVFLDQRSSQIARGESIADTARVVSRYADLIMARVNDHNTVLDFAEWSRVPVINGLSDQEHPCQSLADLFTVLERKGRVEGRRLAYLGDGHNNVTHSLLLGCAQLGMHITVGCPPQLAPNSRYVEAARSIASGTGATVEVTSDPEDAVRDADVVYTDVWVSMGRESDSAERVAALQPYQVNSRLVGLAADDYVFLHCLPAHIGEEVTAEVAYGGHSAIFDEAENRLHVQKALMVFLDQANTEDRDGSRPH
jgi:ornithine carbamoyltransferase